MMNRRKIVLYIASSLDGYIATENHELDWLFAVEGEGDNGYSKFYETIDTVVMGRITYDWIIENIKDDFPYRGKECYVFSKTKKDQDDIEEVSFVHDDVFSFSKGLKNKIGQNIWIVGGGELIADFIREKLIDEITVTVAPILLGKGIPLFKNNDFQTLLELKNINRFNQFVELHYEVIQSKAHLQHSGFR